MDRHGFNQHAIFLRLTKLHLKKIK